MAMRAGTPARLSISCASDSGGPYSVSRPRTSNTTVSGGFSSIYGEKARAQSISNGRFPGACRHANISALPRTLLFVTGGAYGSPPALRRRAAAFPSRGAVSAAFQSAGPSRIVHEFDAPRQPGQHQSALRHDVTETRTQAKSFA